MEFRQRRNFVSAAPADRLRFNHGGLLIAAGFLLSGRFLPTISGPQPAAEAVGRSFLQPAAANAMHVSRLFVRATDTSRVACSQALQGVHGLVDWGWPGRVPLQQFAEHAFVRTRTASIFVQQLLFLLLELLFGQDAFFAQLIQLFELRV